MAKKDKNTAAFLSLVFGWLGIHQLYLSKPGRAIFFLLPLFFAQTPLIGVFIAMMMGFINALVLMMMPQAKFDQTYNSKSRPTWDRKRDYSRRDYDREQRWERRHQTRTTRRPIVQQQRRRPSSTRPIRNVRPPQTRKPNPFKISGVKKYKEYDYEDAIEDFKKALEIDANDVATHFNLACAYSLTEEPEESFKHLHKAVQNGFTDFEKIKTHDDLAFLRIQPAFEEFVKNNFQLTGKSQPEEPEKAAVKDDHLLNQLKKLSELREKGLITEEEYVQERRKLTR